MKGPFIAVIDIGKTNLKLVVVDLHNKTEQLITIARNQVLDGPPWPRFDADAQWAFILAGLAACQAKTPIDAIIVTTLGATAALIDDEGHLAAPILDYEHHGQRRLRPFMSVFALILMRQARRALAGD